MRAPDFEEILDPKLLISVSKKVCSCCYRYGEINYYGDDDDNDNSWCHAWCHACLIVITLTLKIALTLILTQTSNLSLNLIYNKVGEIGVGTYEGHFLTVTLILTLPLLLPES
jgi:hypothetical protein